MVVFYDALSLRILSRSPCAKGVGILCDGKDAFLMLMLYFVLAHALDQTQMIDLLGFGIAPLFESARWTVFIQHHGRRLLGRGLL